ncbi:MAG: 50S ribosomal protein L21 [Candidatus Neomarinimicrobiota bacterium]|tara:strand:- start:207 stop:608 length:402 start_codon:yes stop_codon:yes gene_type:complete
MYAIINISGKQYKTQIGSRLRIPRQTLETGSKVTFEDVLLFSDGENTKIGNPNVKGVSVNAKILAHSRNKKILIYKKKRRKGYQRKNGHRQWYSEIEINDIKFSSTKKSNTKSKAAVAKKAKTPIKKAKEAKE